MILLIFFLSAGVLILVVYGLGHRLRSNIKRSQAVVSLSDEQRSIYNLLENTRQHTFITGKAGTGKSVLLKYFAEHTTKSTVKVAPTGIAALNIRGQTIHSLFKLPIGLVDLAKLTVNKETKQILKDIEAVVIDEVSMVRVDAIDGIDRVMRMVKKVDQPFGGVQMIVFGDVYQLPPVVESKEALTYLLKKYDGVHFFNAPAWSQINLAVYELQVVFRQSDQRFKALLNAVREGNKSPWILEELNRRSLTSDQIPVEDIVILTSTNSAAQKVNREYLSRLRSRSKTYTATIIGDLSAKSLPTDTQLTLKVGAQVMFLKNDASGRWANGTVGKIKSLGKDHVVVSCGKRTYVVKSVTWEKTDYVYDEGADRVVQKVAGTFMQLPLKTAWAMTIHKSQGCTYNKVVVDLGDGAFAHGQVYVALSRCRSFSGLYLTSAINPQDIIVDPLVQAFMKDHLLST